MANRTRWSSATRITTALLRLQGLPDGVRAHESDSAQTPPHLTAMIQAVGADTPDKVVDHFARRFLPVTLAGRDRAVLTEFLRGRLGTKGLAPGPALEESLRETLYLVLSMPEYQVG